MSLTDLLFSLSKPKTGGDQGKDHEIIFLLGV